MRAPTEKQYRVLLNLGGGAALVVANRRTTEPLLRHGWVTAELRGTYYAWVRITPEGLRALAVAVAKHGLPEFDGTPQVERRVCADCGSSRYRFETVDAEEPLP